MDTTTVIVIVAIVVLLAAFFYNRNRPARRGTYDDKNTRSSGSIGGGNRAHDDPDVRSSGSIGGGARGYDAPQHSSGGSIGGGPATSPDREERSAVRPDQREEFERSEQPVRENGARTLPDLDVRNDRSHGVAQDDDDRYARERETRQRKNSDDFQSGGSIGGSSR